MAAHVEARPVLTACRPILGNGNNARRARALDAGKRTADQARRFGKQAPGGGHPGSEHLADVDDRLARRQLLGKAAADG